MSTLATKSASAVRRVEADVGEPRWVSGGSRYGFCDDGIFLVETADGLDRIVELRPDAGAVDRYNAVEKQIGGEPSAAPDPLSLYAENKDERGISAALEGRRGVRAERAAIRSRCRGAWGRVGHGVKGGVGGGGGGQLQRRMFCFQVPASRWV